MTYKEKNQAKVLSALIGRMLPSSYELEQRNMPVGQGRVVDYDDNAKHPTTVIEGSLIETLNYFLDVWWGRFWMSLNLSKYNERESC